MKDNDIVPLQFDMTKRSEESDRLLQLYNSKSIPLLVIIHPKTPNKPIILRDAYTRDQVLAKLREAVGRKAEPAKQASAAGGERASLE